MRDGIIAFCREQKDNKTAGRKDRFPQKKGRWNMAIKWPQIQYREVDNGMQEPMIVFPKQPRNSVGKYGEMRRKYLMKYQKTSYQMMCMNGALKQNLLDINDLVYQMMEDQIRRMAESEAVPDKAGDQLGWIQHMKNLRLRAEERVLRELVFS